MVRFILQACGCRDRAVFVVLGDDGLLSEKTASSGARGVGACGGDVGAAMVSLGSVMAPSGRFRRGRLVRGGRPCAAEARFRYLVYVQLRFHGLQHVF